MSAALAIDKGVAVLGSGTMGRGIARVAAGCGHQVWLFDISHDALQSAEIDLKRFLDRDVEKGRLGADEAAAIGDRISYVADIPALTGASLVIEAIVENLDAKISLLRQIEAQGPPDLIIATNTSSLSVTAIAAGLERPERVAGMHFFNPAPVMPLVEVVTGAESASEVTDVVFSTAAAWGKTPVRAASTPGFIVNRVARPFYGEALRIVEEGMATAPEVDEIVMGAGGFRMGPFALMDLVGLDVNLAVSKSVYEQTFHDPRFAPNQIQQQLVDAGRLGRKSGGGFYDYGGSIAAAAARIIEPVMGVESVIVHGESPALSGLVARLEAAGVAKTAGFGAAAGVAFEGALLWPSNGSPASSVDGAVPDLNVVALDVALDWSTATAVAVAGNDDAALAAAASVLNAAGIEARQVGDAPGLVMLRIMSQLASVAADAVLKGVASPADVDTAMRLGTNYPMGPLEWADAVGPGNVVAVLDNIADYYGESRYRPSSLLRRATHLESNLREEL